MQDQALLEIFDRPYLEVSDAPASGKVLEAFTIQKTGTIETASPDNQQMVRDALSDAAKLLPFASEVYNISSNISDYILVPVTIMYSDLPNRNLVSFPFRELTRFNPEAGQLAYQTWKGRPCYADHCNNDHTQAKGMILETAMRPVPGYIGDFFKVVTLLGFDRNRDPELTRLIMDGTRNCYSMGALGKDYMCSCCNASMRQSGGRCQHIDITNRGKREIKTFGDKLAYRCISDYIGYEVSSVITPAFNMASTKTVW